MGNSWKGGEGRKSWEREDKRGPKLKAFADLGSAGLSFPESAKYPENESGSKPGEPLSSLPDYSGNETKPTEIPAAAEVISEKPFDPAEYRTFAKERFDKIRRSRSFLESNIKKYLNESDQQQYAELMQKFQELNRYTPGSWAEAEKMKGDIEALIGSFFGLQQRIDTEKDFARAAVERVVTEAKKTEEEAPGKAAESQTDDFDYREYYRKARLFIDQDVDIIEKKWEQMTEADQDTYEGLVKEVDALAAAVPASAKEAENLRRRADAVLKKFDSLKEPAKPEAAKMVTIEEFNQAESEAPVSAVIPSEVLPELPLAPELDKATGIGYFPHKPINTAQESAADPLLEINAEKFEADLYEELQKELVATGPINPDSVSVRKLREVKPEITDEEISAELKGRREMYHTLLKHRAELRNSFKPYYEAKRQYRDVYKNQLIGGYEVYKKTNWLGQMFGFNPKNLNSFATEERRKFADSRFAYRDRLETTLNNMLINSKGFNDLVVAADFESLILVRDSIKASFTDRFLLRPAKETLKLQNEIFPEMSRKNIISKFKAAIQANPRLKLALGATAVVGGGASIFATGGLSLGPMLLGVVGAGIANDLSTRFGINKSERALDSALKNAKLEFNADDLVAAEMKLLTAHQDVEISKNRRDVYVTAGGVAGSLVGGGLLSLDSLYGGPDIAPPATDGPRVVLPEPHIEAPQPEVVTPEEPPALATPVTPDLPGAPETPPEGGTDNSPTPEPAPEGELELEDGEEEGEGEEEIFPPGQEPQNIYTVQPGDNFWNIMEGQTAAPQPSTLSWIQENQPEHYQELIKLVENYANADGELRSMLGFGATMDNLQIGSEVNLDELDYLARMIAEDRGWIDHVEIDMPGVPPESQEIINTKVKTISV